MLRLISVSSLLGIMSGLTSHNYIQSSHIGNVSSGHIPYALETTIPRHEKALQVIQRSLLILPARQSPYRVEKYYCWRYLENVCFAETVYVSLKHYAIFLLIQI